MERLGISFLRRGYGLLDAGTRICAILWFSIAWFTFGGHGSWLASAFALAMAVAFVVPVSSYFRHKWFSVLVVVGTLTYALTLVVMNAPSQIPWAWALIAVLKPVAIGWGFTAQLGNGR